MIKEVDNKIEGLMVGNYYCSSNNDKILTLLHYDDESNPDVISLNSLKVSVQFHYAGDGTYEKTYSIDNEDDREILNKMIEFDKNDDDIITFKLDDPGTEFTGGTYITFIRCKTSKNILTSFFSRGDDIITEYDGSIRCVLEYSMTVNVT